MQNITTCYTRRKSIVDTKLKERLHVSNRYVRRLARRNDYDDRRQRRFDQRLFCASAWGGTVSCDGACASYARLGSMVSRDHAQICTSRLCDYLTEFIFSLRAWHA